MLDSNTQGNPAADADSERSQELYHSSQTFLMRTLDPRVARLRLVTIASLLLLFFIVIPLLVVAGIVADYKVNTLGQFLCFAIVALGVDLVWGYTGLLSLCQALFFALGGYAIGMFLSLPEGGGQYARPQCMSYAYYEGHGDELPWFWMPFHHFWFAAAAAVLVPGLVAGLFGFFILRNRVRGVYFSIITQALAAAAALLIARNEMLLGGSNGLNGFYRPINSERKWILGMYLLTLVALVLTYLFCRAITKSRVGRVLIAVRDKETRLYFAGYKPHAFKVFAFSVGAMVAGVGGMLYAPQMAIINAQSMDIEASIYMVVMVALGGRGKLWGAVLGALDFFILRSSLSSGLSRDWNLVLGLIAVCTVLFLPDGLSGLWSLMERRISAGQTVRRASVAALPLVILQIFVLLEALGLMPRFLQADPARPESIPMMYIILVVLLVGAGILQWQIHRADQKTAAAAAGESPPAAAAPSVLPLAATGAEGGH